MIKQPQSLATDGNSWENAFVEKRLPAVEYDERFLRGRPTFNLNIVDTQGFDDLRELLRDIRLKGDSTVKVYERATITMRKYKISDLSPLSLYLLRPQLSLHQNIFAHLMNHYQLNLFALAGIMDYERTDEYFRMVPPIVEVYFDPKLGKKVAAVIDGLHRTYAARQLGLEELWVVEVSDVPTLLPPVALPVSWEDVKLYDVVPHIAEKRRYRYQAPADYPGLSTITKVPIRKENYIYFLYRDFEVLGSSGIRRPQNHFFDT